MGLWHSGSRSLQTNALIKNCRIQLPKPETVRISCGPRAQPALTFIVEIERVGYERPKESSGRMVLVETTRNERSPEEERGKTEGTYAKVYSIRDGDVPRVAATDFAGE